MYLFIFGDAVLAQKGLMDGLGCIHNFLDEEMGMLATVDIAGGDLGDVDILLRQFKQMPVI